eukprot:1417821-Pyramimonas_sp.AAC.2
MINVVIFSWRKARWVPRQPLVRSPQRVATMRLPSLPSLPICYARIRTRLTASASVSLPSSLADALPVAGGLVPRPAGIHEPVHDVRRGG